MPPIEPTELATAAAVLAHRLNVARLRLTAGVPLCEARAHLEALLQDTWQTLELIEAHPDQEAMLVVDDLGPDADFLTAHLG
jgi:adenine/guanine phosphoribosyltransferase-like PRPP-binding protein